MADLSFRDASLAVNIVGANANGEETNHVNAFALGGLCVSDVLTQLSSAEIQVSTVQIEAKVGAQRMQERKFLLIIPTTGNIYVSFAQNQQGFRLVRDQIFSIAANAPVYIRAITGSVSVFIAEGA